MVRGMGGGKGGENYKEKYLDYTLPKAGSEMRK
jgi:hypothetical protein